MVILSRNKLLDIDNLLLVFLGIGRETATPRTNVWRHQRRNPSIHAFFSQKDSDTASFAGVAQADILAKYMASNFCT